MEIEKKVKTKFDAINYFSLEFRHILKDFSNVEVVKWFDEEIVIFEIKIIQQFFTKEDIDKIEYLGFKEYNIEDNKLNLKLRYLICK